MDYYSDIIIKTYKVRKEIIVVQYKSLYGTGLVVGNQERLCESID